MSGQPESERPGLAEPPAAVAGSSRAAPLAALEDRPAAWLWRWTDRIGRSLASLAPRTLGMSAAGAGLLIIVLFLAGVIPALLGDPPATEGTFALILFNAAARADRIATILAVNGAAIVEGPRPGGIYRIRIGAANMPAAARLDAMSKLAADKATVTFVANP